MVTTELVFITSISFFFLSKGISKLSISFHFTRKSVQHPIKKMTRAMFLLVDFVLWGGGKTDKINNLGFSHDQIFLNT